MAAGKQFQDSEGRGRRQKVGSQSWISVKQNLAFSIPRSACKNPKERSLGMQSWNVVLESSHSFTNAKTHLD